MAFGKNKRQQQSHQSTETTDTASVEQAHAPQQETKMTDTATVQAAPEKHDDSRFKKVKLEDGTLKNRAEYIRELWNGGMSRGQITKKLNELNSVEHGGDGKKIPYQVVFAVIKKGGTKERPDPGREASAPAAEQKTSEAAAA